MINILIIEDDAAIASMLESALSSDHRVRTSHNGQVALQVLRENRFDLVITDITMPGFDGFEVIMDINRMQPRPGVIAMTGHTGSQNREYLSNIANALNVYRMLYKPFSIAELMKSVVQFEDGRGVDAGNTHNEEGGNTHADR